MFQLGDWIGGLCLPVSLFLWGLTLMASVFVFTGNSNDPWQRGHPWVYIRPGLLVLQTGKCLEFCSLEVKIQHHSSSVSPGVLSGSMHCWALSSSSLVQMNWGSEQGQPPFLLPRLLSVAIEGSGSIGLLEAPSQGTYAMLFYWWWTESSALIYNLSLVTLPGGGYRGISVLKGWFCGSYIFFGY